MNGKNIKISGSGAVSSGEYDSIKLSGSAKLFGEIKCGTISSSGTIKSEAKIYAGNIKTSGNATFYSDVRADSISSSGNFKSEGALSCGEISVSGSAKIAQSISARKNARFSGIVRCGGSLRAGEVNIKFSSRSEFSAIDGKIIRIHPTRAAKLLRKRLTVISSITGDKITLKNVVCPHVHGRIVTVGSGCVIDRLEYTESADVSRRAKVGKTEKL